MKKMSILALAMFAMLFSCKKDEMINQSNKSERTGEKIVLGKKLNNPYTIENMQSAFNSLSVASKMELNPTDYYVRILPHNADELDNLEQDLGLLLFTHPLDYEFEQDGDYYIDPAFEGKEFQWFYTVVPIDFNFGSLEYEILDEAFLYHEDRENQVSEEVFDEIELESEYLTGNISEEEYYEYKSGKKTKQTVSGCITEFDNVVSGNKVPVKGIHMRAWKFLKISHTYTNGNGCFQFPKKYKSAHVKAFAEDIFGNRARGASSNLILLDLIINIRHKIGYFSNSQLSNIQHNFHFDNPNTDGRKKWVAFACMDAAWDMNNISASQYQINRKINKTNIWINNLSQDYGAPNLNKLKQSGSTMVTAANATIVGLFSLFGLPGWIYSAIVTSFKPDFFIPYNSNGTANRIRTTIYHEFGHNFEYQETGVSFWEDYIIHIVANGGYGNGTQPNSGLVAVMESWTEDYSLSIANVYYQSAGNISSFISSNSNDVSYNHLNERRRGDINNDNGFIRQGYYYDLQDGWNKDLPTETIFWQGQRGDYFEGWTYSLQLQSMNGQTRSYRDHRAQMQALQTPYSPYGAPQTLDNIVNRHMAN